LLGQSVKDLVDGGDVASGRTRLELPHDAARATLLNVNHSLEEVDVAHSEPPGFADAKT
jgi:hypothetical protein